MLTLPVNQMISAPVPHSHTAGADDTDIAFRIGFKDIETTDYSAATVLWDATRLRITLTPTGGSPTNYDFANATYTTVGAMIAAVKLNATVGPLVWIRAVSGLDASLTAGLLARSVTTLLVAAGVSVFHDASAALYRYMCLGRETMTNDSGQAQTGEATLPFFLEDDEQLRQTYNISPQVCVAEIATFTFTLNVSAVYLDLYRTGGDDGDVRLVRKTIAGSSSAVTVTLNADDNPNGWFCKPGERIVARIGDDGSTLPASATGTMTGLVGV